MQRLRNVIDRVVTYIGVLLVLVTVVFTDASGTQIPLVVTGLLLLQVGMWRGASALLPSARRNHALRDQVNQFIKLVREMYRVANAKEASAFDTVADKLRARTEAVIDAARVDLA